MSLAARDACVWYRQSALSSSAYQDLARLELTTPIEAEDPALITVVERQQWQKGAGPALRANMGEWVITTLMSAGYGSSHQELIPLMMRYYKNLLMTWLGSAD